MKEVTTLGGGKRMQHETHKECKFCGATERLYIMSKDCKCCGKIGKSKCEDCVNGNEAYQKKVYERTGNWPIRAGAKWKKQKHIEKSEDWK